MNYSKIYNELVERCQNRIFEGYGENHHILPKCFGGSNNSDNIVRLTARERFVAHLLLYKMQTENKKMFQMLKACIMMSGKKKFNSKLYENAKLKHSKLLSERMSGKNHPMYGTSRSGVDNPFYGKFHSKETREHLSKCAMGLVIARDTRTDKIVKVSKEEFDNCEHYIGSTKGTKLSEANRKKISEGFKKRPILTCPYCGKSSNNNMKRYHFNNCKQKNN